MEEVIFSAIKARDLERVATEISKNVSVLSNFSRHQPLECLPQVREHVGNVRLFIEWGQGEVESGAFETSWSMVHSLM